MKAQTQLSTGWQLVNNGIPINIPQRSRHVRRGAQEHKRQKYYDSLDDVLHNRWWKDGERIWIVNGANYDEYVFVRLNQRDLDGGEWRSTGVTTGAAATW